MHESEDYIETEMLQSSQKRVPINLFHDIQIWEEKWSEVEDYKWKQERLVTNENLMF